MKTFRKFFAIVLLALAAVPAFSQSKKPWEVEEDTGLRKAFTIGNDAFLTESCLLILSAGLTIFLTLSVLV